MKLVNIVALLLVALSVQSCSVSTPRASQQSEEEISYLINIFDRSDIRLVVNGDEFTGDGAVKIMRKRFEHYRSDIHTAEDFIRICATNSASSGDLLTVKTKKGDHPVHLWLENKLQAYRRR